MERSESSSPKGSDAKRDGQDPPPASPMRGIPLGVILAILALVTTLPVALFAVRLILAIRDDQLAVIERTNVETARAVSGALDQEFQSVSSTLQLISYLDLLDTTDDVGRFQELAFRLIPRQRGWLGVVLATPSGRILLDTRASPGNTLQQITEPWLSRVLETRRPTVSDLLEDAAGRFHVVVAVPVQRQRDVVSVLAASIRSETFSEVLRNQDPPPDGVVTLIDRSRRIVARTRGESQYVGMPPSPDFTEASARMTEGSWRATLLEGTPAYASLSTSSDTGWTVGIGMPSEAIDGPIRRSLLALVGGGLGILAFGVTAALILGRMVVRSLRTASKAAHALVREGQLPPMPSRITEVAELARGLEDAASTLRRRLLERDRAEQERAKAATDREAALVAEQAALRARDRYEARLAVTLKSIGDAVIATDDQGQVTVTNPVAQILTGWSEAEAVGQPIREIFEIINEETRERIEDPVNDVLREGRIAGLAEHTVLVSRNGSEVPIEDSAAPIRGPDGELLGAVLVFRDVTQRREAERRRADLLDREQEARREAEALSQSKDEFVATVSHELRTPLNAIFGWVRLLRSRKLDPDIVERALDVIERNTRSQAQLIDDLLDMSRIITGKLRLDRRSVAVGPIAEAVIESVRPTAEAKGISLQLYVTREEGAWVLGDADRLQQVLWNLINNAIKFTPHGGSIETRVETNAGEVVVSVRDTGIGISKSLLPHVFERFRQGASSNTQEQGGLGLGLALVRNLIELHGGTVSAASDGEGKGSTFQFRLMREQEGQTQAPRSVLPAGETKTWDGSWVLEGLRVLLVDDDDDAREIIGTALRQAGAHIMPAASARDACEIFDSSEVDAIVSDIAMPQGSGVDVVEHVRSTKRGRNLPIVALTAYARPEDRQRALDAGFDLHIGKPQEPGAVVNALAMLRHSRTRGTGEP